MAPIASVIVALDELAGPEGTGAGPEAWAMLVDLARQGCDVWLAGSCPVPPVEALRTGLQEGVLRKADSLEQAVRQCATRGRRVLVVGALPSRSVKLANHLRLASVLVTDLAEAPDHQPADVAELPDFVVSSLTEIPSLVRRLEREPEDFAGTE